MGRKIPSMMTQLGVGKAFPRSSVLQRSYDYYAAFLPASSLAVGNGTWSLAFNPIDRLHASALSFHIPRVTARCKLL